MRFPRYINLALLCSALAACAVINPPTSVDSEHLSVASLETRAEPHHGGTAAHGTHHQSTSQRGGTHGVAPAANAGRKSKGVLIPVLVYPKKGLSPANVKKFEKMFKRAVPHGKIHGLPEVKKQFLLWRAMMPVEDMATLEKEARGLVEKIRMDQPLKPQKWLKPDSKRGNRISSAAGAGAGQTRHHKAASNDKHRTRRGVNETVELHTLSKRAVEAQGNAPWELVQISLARNRHVQANPVPHTFRWTSPAAKGVRIYSIDGGLNKGHQEVRDWLARPSQPKLRWLHASGWAPQVEADDDDGHGSCVWSKAISPTYGVARDAHFTAVRVTDHVYPFVDMKGHTHQVKTQLAGDIINAYILTYQDIYARKIHFHDPIKNEPSIITTSINTAISDVSIRTTLSSIIGNLAQLGVPIFYATANSQGQAIDTVGDAMIALQPHHPNIFTVGGTDKTGHRRQGSASNAGHQAISFWAPGDGLTCISGTGTTGRVTVNGNSASTPLVAGVAADFMQKNPAHRRYDQLAAILRRHSVQRAHGGPFIIGNDQVV